jgi:hypothetical protein
MFAESEFDEIVLFEAPAEYADRLQSRLKQTRLTWLHRIDDELYVAAALRAERNDLAVLLREAQAWIAEADLPYLALILDGREYVLGPNVEPLAGRTV